MACPKCQNILQSHAEQPFEPNKAAQPTGDTYVCPCGQRWWRYDRGAQFWRTVNDEAIWEQILSGRITPLVSKAQDAGQHERKEFKIPFRVPDGDIRNLVHNLRVLVLQEKVDIQATIAFPEAPAQGGWMTRPYSRGGPDVWVTISVPSENETVLRSIESQLSQADEPDTKFC